MLSSTRLAVIAEVARMGSIAAAAEALHLTPSAVSHQLSRFEKELGVALVERGPRSLRLTDAGRRMAERANSIARLMLEAEEEVIAHGRGQAGRLRIGFFYSGGLRILPGALSEFVRAHPSVELSLFPGQPHELLPTLVDGDLDVSVIFDSATAPYTLPNGVDVLPLLDDPQHLVLPASHPLADTGPVRVSDLADEPWIATQGTPQGPSVLERLCAAAGFTPAVLCRTDHYDVIVELVRAGMGVSLVPTLALHPWPVTGIALAAIDGPPVTRTVGVATRAGNPNPFAPVFVQQLKRAAVIVGREIADHAPLPSGQW